MLNAKAETMFAVLTAAAKSGRLNDLTPDERAALKQCYERGIETESDIAAITAVYERFKGVKTPPKQAGELMAWINEGRRSNGIAECG